MVKWRKGYYDAILAFEIQIYFSVMFDSYILSVISSAFPKEINVFIHEPIAWVCLNPLVFQNSWILQYIDRRS